MQSKKPFFATPQDAEAAFYDALERADLEAMMSVWAEDEEIVCVHPTGPRLSGFAQVQESWRRIFRGGPGMKVKIASPIYMQGLLLAIHCVHEQITVPGEASQQATVVATNVFVRGAMGWRMLVHHGSPAPKPPEAVAGTAKTLH